MRGARVVLAVVVVALGQSCALRHRYRDFVSPKTEAKTVQLLVTDGNGAPVPNVKVELSEWKNKVAVTSAADGTFSLPVEKKYLDENPVLVLLLPPGTSRYALALAPPPLPVAPPEPPAASPIMPAPELPEPSAPATEPAAAPAPPTPAPENKP